MPTSLRNLIRNEEGVTPVSLGDGASDGEGGVGLLLVDLAGLLGLALVLVPREFFGWAISQTWMWTFGGPLHQAEVLGVLGLELGDVEEDRHVGLERLGGLGGVGPRGVGLDPAGDLLGSSTRLSFLTFLRRAEVNSRARSRPRSPNSAPAPGSTWVSTTTFFPFSEGPGAGMVGSKGWRK